MSALADASSRRKGRLHWHTLAVATGVTLAGCGGGGDTTYVPVAVPVAAAPAPAPSPDEQLQPYREQTLNWEVCDPTILGNGGSLDVPGLEGRLHCAYLRAPLDYNDPSRGEVSVAMLRLSVADASKKRGTLFMNPGGPGSDGLWLALRLAQAYLGQSDPGTEIGALQLRLLDEYDVVGFSPRGTGASTRLECGTNELSREVNGTPEGRTAQAIEDMLYNDRKQAEACRKNPLTPYINTDAVARDMDLMRGLVGDEKLNYVGISWGTWLGGWYAARFPERTGRMVLDSNMNFAGNDVDGDFRKRHTMGFQRVWDEVYAPYAARHADVFNLGSTAAEVRAAFLAIRPAIRNQITTPLVTKMYAVHDQIDDALIAVTAAARLSATRDAMPGASVSDIRDALQPAGYFVPTNPGADAAARASALDLLTQVSTPAAAQSVALPWGGAVNIAVKCNDTPAITDVDYWIALGNAYAQTYPMLGSRITSSACTYWGGPSVTRPPVEALAPLDILMVQSQYDGPTPVEGAREAFAALPNGHMVYVQGEATHGVFPYMQACVDGPVIRYLLGESPSARETVCDAKPFARDAAQMRRSAEVSAFKDPEAAQALISEFKRGVAR